MSSCTIYRPKKGQRENCSSLVARWVSIIIVDWLSPFSVWMCKIHFDFDFFIVHDCSTEQGAFEQFLTSHTWRFTSEHISALGRNYLLNQTPALLILIIVCVSSLPSLCGIIFLSILIINLICQISLIFQCSTSPFIERVKGKIACILILTICHVHSAVPQGEGRVPESGGECLCCGHDLKIPICC